MPKNLKAESCDAVLETALQDIDWCAAAEANGCSLATDENDTSWSTAQFQKALEDIVENQQIIYNYLQEGFDGTNKAINSLSNGNLKEPAEEIIDEKEQQRLELQAKIEALQAEMESL